MASRSRGRTGAGSGAAAVNDAKSSRNSADSYSWPAVLPIMLARCANSTSAPIAAAAPARSSPDVRPATPISVPPTITAVTRSAPSDHASWPADDAAQLTDALLLQLVVASAQEP